MPCERLACRASSTVLSCFSKTTGLSRSRVDTFVLIMSCLTSLLNSLPLILLGHVHGQSGLPPPIPADPSAACTPWSSMYEDEGV